MGQIIQRYVEAQGGAPEAAVLGSGLKTWCRIDQISNVGDAIKTLVQMVSKSDLTGL